MSSAGSGAVEAESLAYAYPGEDGRRALKGVSFSAAAGEIFGLLGPNGSGKTTLFKILSTQLSPDSGKARLFGLDLAARASEARGLIGVVFQQPSVDKRLSVRENLEYQGRLYGLGKGELGARIGAALERFGLSERSARPVGALSGGLQRRVELAKALLHRPRLLILDEPSTGLDPGARLDLWAHLRELRSRDGVSVLVTTHWMEEAERCGRLAILHEGAVVACGTPDELKSGIRGDVLTLDSAEPEALAAGIRERLGAEASVVEGSVRVERDDGARFLPVLAEAFPGMIRRATVGRPTLEDVFIDKTGHRLRSGEGA